MKEQYLYVTSDGKVGVGVIENGWITCEYGKIKATSVYHVLLTKAGGNTVNKGPNQGKLTGLGISGTPFVGVYWTRGVGYYWNNINKLL